MQHVDRSCSRYVGAPRAQRGRQHQPLGRARGELDCVLLVFGWAKFNPPPPIPTNGLAIAVPFTS
eukprot:6487242-Pyramimonas_sp.AAC.1